MTDKQELINLRRQLISTLVQVENALNLPPGKRAVKARLDRRLTKVTRRKVGDA